MAGEIRYLDKVKIFTKAILVNNEGKILALRRSKTAFRRALCWDFPGGNFEKGENILESLRREVMEEVGVGVSVVKPVHVDSSSGIVMRGLDVIAMCFVARVGKTAVKLSGEHDKYQWVDPKGFLALDTGDDGGFLKASVREFMEMNEA